MSEYVGAARSLYLELRALGLKVWVEDDPDGVVLDYGPIVDGLRSLPEASARSARRRIRRHKEGFNPPPRPTRPRPRRRAQRGAMCMKQKGAEWCVRNPL